MASYSPARLEARYQEAREVYADLGVDTEKAMETLAGVSLSLHCWQGDDVGGFEHAGGLSGGGIMATGNYPGRARNPDELRQDLEQTYALLPGNHRLSLHAIYGEFGGRRVDRHEVGVEHFQGWIDWARARGLGLDFNQTFFSHPKAESGFTLAHPDAGVREFWIEHGRRCRRIAAEMGRQLGKTCICNVWIPDGYKDLPVDRLTPRQVLAESLDAVFAESLDPAHMRDAVESKLFGIGSESCVIGSHEFYLGYALSRGKILTLDCGHFHPTEVVSDKLSSVLCFLDEVLLHISRGVRWDSDHVVLVTDELLAIAQELVRHQFLGRVHVGLDFFDASINRIAAWTIGSRAMLKALTAALLEPTAKLRAHEEAGDYTGRLALLEECKSLPWGAVWDYHCLRQGVPAGPQWLDEVIRYENEVLSRRV